MKKPDKKLKILIKALIATFILSILFTALTAFLPYPPFTIINENDAKNMKFGFPVAYTSLTPDADQLSKLIKNNVNKSFILPRYDKYDGNFSILNAIICLLINTVAFFGIWFLFKYFKKFMKVFVIIFAFSMIISIISVILPAPPNTFKSIEELQPMHFGFPISFVEQTPDISIISTSEIIDDYIRTSYISPNYKLYDVKINFWGFIIASLLTTFIIAILVSLFAMLKVIIKLGPKSLKTYLVFRLNSVKNEVKALPERIK